jgi:Holliday junction resolvasome RuvABC endonuclease subunit
MSDSKTEYKIIKLINKVSANDAKLDELDNKLMAINDSLLVIREMLSKLPDQESVADINIRLDALNICGPITDGKFSTPANNSTPSRKVSTAKTKSKNDIPTYLKNIQTFFKEYFNDEKVRAFCIEKKLFTLETIEEQKNLHINAYNAKKTQADKNKFLARKVYDTFAGSGNPNKKKNQEMLKSIKQTMLDAYIKENEPPLEKEELQKVKQQGKKINMITVGN